MSEQLGKILRDYIAKHYIENNKRLIFTTKNGGYITNTQFFRSVWGPLLQRLGMRDDGKAYHFRALRHFCASMLCKHMPISDVPALLGHATLDTTLQVYAHEIAAPHALAAAVQAMASELKPRPES